VVVVAYDHTGVVHAAMFVTYHCCQIDVMASIDKRIMIKTLKQFLQPYVGAKADNFDVST